MQSFRKKYIYNPQNPIFSNSKVKTYNCMNTQTKDKKLILIHHLEEPPFVEKGLGILQPIQSPTQQEPFSVYPITRCVSEIGKVGQPEAMYVLKCLIQSKLENALYSVVSNQGICRSNIEGILPSKSPDLFNIAIQLLDIPANLSESDKSVVSKEGYGICKGIREGANVLDSIAEYGWKDIKKEKQKITDNEFITFMSRRKEEGPFGDEYGLAWHNEHGLCRFKYINLSRDGYEEQFYEDFEKVVTYFQQENNKKINALKIYKFTREPKGIKIFSQIPNQGNLSDYIAVKHKSSKPLTEKIFAPVLENFVQSMRIVSADLKSSGIGTLHIRNLFMHGNKICIGEPLLVTDKIEKKMRQLKNSMDYFSPQLKEKIILPEELFKLDREKMDIWLYGFILHKIFTKEVPIFDSGRKPIIAKDKLSLAMGELITSCLDLVPEKRPGWRDVNMLEMQKKAVMIEQVEESNERENFRLGTRSERRKELSTPQKKKRSVEELILEEEMTERKVMDDDDDKLKPEEDEDEPYASPVPVQISSRLKKVKLVIKIILIFLLYTFVFFRPFLGNSIDLLLTRSYYSTTSLHLVDYSNSQLSTTTILTSEPLFFLQNDISFAKIQEEYKCIDDHFDPITNPDYSLLSYIQSSSFLALLLCGWLTFILICVTKFISIWKGGISNRPHRGLCKFWVVYIFHELSLAAILFAHFFMFQFFYFAGSEPCLSVENFSGIQPFFDSTLYLFLSNEDGYLQTVFATLGVFSCLLFISTCFYAWGPKLDNKYFISIPSILFRIIPFILLLLICRIGVFELYSPTAINDEISMIPAIISGSVIGFFGIIPEVFILICIAVEAILEAIMYWCQSKAAESDELSKMFNIKKKKVTNNDESQLNDMSLVNNSKHKLQSSEIY